MVLLVCVAAGAHDLKRGDAGSHDDEQAQGEALPERRDSHEDHGVLDDDDEQCAEHDARQRALAAGDGGAAQDDGRDDHHFHAEQVGGVHLSHGAGADHAGQGGDDADEDVEPELGGAHLEADAGGRGLVAAEGEEGASEHRVAGDEEGHRDDRDEDQEGHGHGGLQAGAFVAGDEEGRGSEGAHGLGDRVDLHGFERALHDAVEDVGGAQGDDQRRHGQPRGEDAVECAEDRSEGGGDQEGHDDGPVPPVVDEDFRGHVDREGGQRREGHVDAAGDEDEVRGDGEEAGHHHRAGQVDEVVRRVELSGARLDDEGERRDDQEHPEFVGAQDFRDESGH